MLATACVSDAPRPDGYTAVPPERLLSPQVQQPFPGATEITVKKIAGGLFQKSCFGRLSVESTPIAEMYAGEQLVIYLARGQYALSFLPKGLCQGPRAVIDIQVRAGETRLFQILAGPSGNFAIVEVGR